MSPRRRFVPLLIVTSALVLAACAARASDGPGGPGVVVGDVSPQTTATTEPGTPSTTAPPTPIGRTPDGDVQDGVEVTGDGYHGWLIDPDAHEGWMFDDGAALLFPTAEEAAAAEAVLVEALPVERDRQTEYRREQLDEVLADLAGYERQYAAAEVDGSTLLYVNALCTTDVAGGDLSTTVIGVDDGGSCFWNAIVDLDQAELVHISVNGQA